MCFAMARLLKTDDQGRIVLPPTSIEQAGLANEVTLVGNDDHIEIWPRDQWNTHAEKGKPDLGEVLSNASHQLAINSAGSP